MRRLCLVVLLLAAAVPAKASTSVMSQSKLPGSGETVYRTTLPGTTLAEAHTRTYGRS